MEMTRKTTKELRDFGLTFGALIVGFFGVLIPLIKKSKFHQWPFVIGMALAALAFIVPNVLRPLEVVFMKVGEVLGFINTRIILTVIYYVILFPLGLYDRITKRDLLNRKIIKDKPSYRIIRTQTSSMEYPY